MHRLANWFFVLGFTKLESGKQRAVLLLEDAGDNLFLSCFRLWTRLPLTLQLQVRFPFSAEARHERLAAFLLMFFMCLPSPTVASLLNHLQTTSNWLFGPAALLFIGTSDYSKSTHIIWNNLPISLSAD